MSDKSETYRKLTKQKKAERHRRSSSIAKHWTQKNVNQLIKDASARLDLNKKAVSALRTTYKTATKAQRGDLIRNLVTLTYTQKKAESVLTTGNTYATVLNKKHDITRLNYSKLLESWAGHQKGTIKGLRESLKESLKEYTPTGVTYSSAWNEKVAKEVGNFIKKHGRGPSNRELEIIEKKAFNYANKVTRRTELKRREYATKFGDAFDEFFDTSPTGAEETGNNSLIEDTKKQFDKEKELEQWLMEKDPTDYF